MDRCGGRLVLALVLGSGLFASACGPISTTLALSDAESAIAAARAADALRYARYELSSADEYIRKAREEEGFSDFQAAIDLARKAQEFAEKARARALKNPLRGGGPSVPAGGPDGVAPEDDPLGSHL